VSDQTAIETYIRSGGYSTWMRPAPTLNLPKDQILQRHLLRKIKETTDVSMTIEELEEGLRNLGFEPTNKKDPLAVSWVRRQPKKD